MQEPEALLTEAQGELCYFRVAGLDGGQACIGLAGDASRQLLDRGCLEQATQGQLDAEFFADPCDKTRSEQGVAA